MNEENKIVETQEEVDLMDNDELKEAIQAQLRKFQNYGMMVGSQTVFHVILDKINAFERSVGKKSNNDHKRLIKEIKRICETGLSRQAKFEDNESENNDNNTKLMEE